MLQPFFILRKPVMYKDIQYGMFQLHRCARRIDTKGQMDRESTSVANLSIFVGDCYFV